MAYEEADDEKVALEILKKEFDWYSDVIEKMEKTFKWSELCKDDRKLFVDVSMEIGKTGDLLCDLMDIPHEDLSNLKSLINDERAKFYNYMFEFSHKASDLALQDYYASFQPSSTKNSLPFLDSKEEDKDRDTGKNTNNISSKTEPPEMIAKKGKRSFGAEDDEGEEEESNDTYYPEPPSVLEFMHHVSTEYGVYPDIDHSDLNYRFDDNQDDYYFD